MVGGISSAARSAPTIQRSPSCVSAPSCTSMRTSSPTKSGLPSLVASTLAGDGGGQIGGADDVGGEPHRRAGVEAGRA